jgi:hypothetical protein
LKEKYKEILVSATNDTYDILKCEYDIRKESIKNGEKLASVGSIEVTKLSPDTYEELGVHISCRDMTVFKFRIPPYKVIANYDECKKDRKLKPITEDIDKEEYCRIRRRTQSCYGK